MHCLVLQLVLAERAHFFASDVEGATLLGSVYVSLALWDLCVWGVIRREGHNEFSVVPTEVT